MNGDQRDGMFRGLWSVVGSWSLKRVGFRGSVPSGGRFYGVGPTRGSVRLLRSRVGRKSEN